MEDKSSNNRLVELIRHCMLRSTRFRFHIFSLIAMPCISWLLNEAQFCWKIVSFNSFLSVQFARTSPYGYCIKKEQTGKIIQHAKNVLYIFCYYVFSSFYKKDNMHILESIANSTPIKTHNTGSTWLWHYCTDENTPHRCTTLTRPFPHPTRNMSSRHFFPYTLYSFHPFMLWKVWRGPEVLCIFMFSCQCEGPGGQKCFSPHQLLIESRGELQTSSLLRGHHSGLLISNF